MLSRLDRYIARSFIEPFLVATAAIVGLYLVADAFGNLDKYLHEAGGFFEALRRMGQVYLLRIPSYLVPVLPISMLVGASYGISQLSARNEIMAMKASGVSFWRILTPIYAAGAVVALLGFANREALVPRLERMIAPEEQVWVGKGERYEQVMDYLEEERTLYRMMYNMAKRRARSVFIVQHSPDGAATHLFAREAEPTREGWILRQAYGSQGAAQEKLWRTSLRPRDLELRLLPAEARPIRILRRLIRSSEAEAERRTWRFYYYSRLAYPFTGLVLMALGVPFVIGHERIQRSRLLGIGVCLAICMVFYTVQFIARDLGQTGQLPPAVAAWLPPVIFAGVALYLLETVHQ